MQKKLVLVMLVGVGSLSAMEGHESVRLEPTRGSSSSVDGQQKTPPKKSTSRISDFFGLGKGKTEPVKNDSGNSSPTSPSIDEGWETLDRPTSHTADTHEVVAVQDDDWLLVKSFEKPVARTDGQASTSPLLDNAYREVVVKSSLKKGDELAESKKVDFLSEVTDSEGQKSPLVDSSKAAVKRTRVVKGRSKVVAIDDASVKNLLQYSSDDFDDVVDKIKKYENLSPQDQMQLKSNAEILLQDITEMGQKVVATQNALLEPDQLSARNEQLAIKLEDKAEVLRGQHGTLKKFLEGLKEKRKQINKKKLEDANTQ